MGPLDLGWHVLNFFAPALGVGMLASALAKLLWRRGLQRVGWLRLSLWASGCSALTLLLGLLAFGSDGRIATYMAMVLVCALSLWVVGFVRRRR